jgi:[ribosomal protein S5]-alanine N-acetyltransferase
VTAITDKRESPARLEIDGFLLTLAPPAAAGRVPTYLRRNWDRFAPVMPTPPERFFEATWWARRLEQNRAAFEAGTAVHLLLLEGDEHGRIAGDISYTNIVRGAFQACHLGFKVDRNDEGTGVMTKALQAANRYVFDELNLHRIMANHLPANTRSARLLARLGFVVEGHARDYLRIDGRWQDHVLTSLTNPDWRPAQG